MNLQIAGHHVEVTPALRLYVENKLDPVIRHFDKVTGVNVILSVEKLKQTAEVTVHVPGKDMHVEESGEDLYAAIDCSTSWTARFRNTSKRFRTTIGATSPPTKWLAEFKTAAALPLRPCHWCNDESSDQHPARRAGASRPRNDQQEARL